MNKLSKEKRQKLLLVAIGTGGVLAALYLLVVTSQMAALAECANKLDSVLDKLSKAENWVRMAPGIESKLEASRKELESKHEGMAPVDKFKWFYNTLEQSLARSQVKVTDITKEPELGEVGVLPKFPYRAATFGVKLRARYHEFGSFLADFENQFPHMRVQNVEMEPEGSARGSAKEPSAVADHAGQDSENLSITMRVVTLVKPSAPL
jgi:hypothetical protein